MERGDARRICCRRSAQLTRRQTTSPSVNLPLSPLPEVAVGAAAPLLSFFFLHSWPLSELLPVKFRVAGASFFYFRINNRGCMLGLKDVYGVAKVCGL
ncbi:uncharacterized protein DS421_19g664780 [Arachis hypogaea]|uniref:Uncharacterized protein n=1 Tax=Arachis hypogaea TaxID=3818 RepID=A0A6B9VBQ8_ARAHY|nr:uncharacterized protein DS421_19g664780 [Arachis hypogaea]